MPIISMIMPIMLQLGPNPATGGVPDHSDLIHDRPPRIDEVAQPEPSWLAQCLDLIDQDPARAHVQAQMERERSTGDQRVLANHCLGLASTQLGRWAEAEAAFLAARDEVAEDDLRLRARLGAMAANAALAVDDTGRAMQLLDRALGDARTAAAGDMVALIQLDRARALVALGQLGMAEEALADARSLRPHDAEARLLSATLLRRMDRLEEAQIQIEEAARFDPANPQIGLEAGVIAILAGRENAARESWQSVISLAANSDEARIARQYLDQLGPQPSAAAPSSVSPSPAPPPSSGSQ